MLQREKECTTYIGNGVAIPHGISRSEKDILRSGIVVLQYPEESLITERRPTWSSESPERTMSIWIFWRISPVFWTVRSMWTGLSVAGRRTRSTDF